MMSKMNRHLRTVLILTVVLLLSTCELLFYSPAFMPAISETEVRVDRVNGTIEEWYNDEFTAGWNVNVDPPSMPLLITNNSTSGNSVPAMEPLWQDHQIDPWYGIVEYLGLFFNPVGINVGGSIPTWTPGSGPSINHFGQSFNYEYKISDSPSYDLPFAAVEGIDGGGYQDSIGYAVSVVDVRVTSPTADALEGEGTFVFSDTPDHRGLLYGVYEHTGLGLTTVFYRYKQSPAGIEVFFPSGEFTYLINVFQH